MNPDDRTLPRVTILDDHVLVAESLAAALTLRGAATAILVDPGELIADVVRDVVLSAPDLVLVDLVLAGGRSGIELVQPLLNADLRVAIVTAEPFGAAAEASRAAGAIAVFDKTLSLRHLLDQVLDVAHSSRARPRTADLTTAERSVLGELIEGRTVTEIADRRRVSVATVRTQVRAVLSKLGVGTQLAAVALARREGWTAPD